VGYGYGWVLQEEPGYERLAYHSGSWPGYISFYMHFLDEDKTVIILSNDEYLNTPKFGIQLARILVN